MRGGQERVDTFRARMEAEDQEQKLRGRHNMLNQQAQSSHNRRFINNCLLLKRMGVHENHIFQDIRRAKRRSSPSAIRTGNNQGSTLGL